MTGYDGLGLDSPKLGSSPKYSEETVTCDSDGKPGHDDYIKGTFQSPCPAKHFFDHYF